MKQYRILYSKQKESYKIQYKFLFLFWLNLDCGEFKTLLEAKYQLKNHFVAYDWEPVKEREQVLKGESDE